MCILRDKSNIREIAVRLKVGMEAWGFFKSVRRIVGRECSSLGRRTFWQISAPHLQPHDEPSEECFERRKPTLAA